MTAKEFILEKRMLNNTASFEVIDRLLRDCSTICRPNADNSAVFVSAYPKLLYINIKDPPKALLQYLQEMLINTNDTNDIYELSGPLYRGALQCYFSYCDVFLYFGTKRQTIAKYESDGISTCEYNFKDYKNSITSLVICGQPIHSNSNELSYDIDYCIKKCAIANPNLNCYLYNHIDFRSSSYSYHYYYKSTIDFLKKELNDEEISARTISTEFRNINVEITYSPVTTMFPYLLDIDITANDFFKARTFSMFCSKLLDGKYNVIVKYYYDELIYDIYNFAEDHLYELCNELCERILKEGNTLAND